MFLPVLLAAVVASAAGATTGAGAAPIQLAGDGTIDLAPGLGLLEDRTSSLSIRAAAVAPGFHVPSSAELNRGFSTSAFWLRFTVISRDPGVRIWYLEVFRSQEHIDLYRRTPDGGFAKISSGRLTPIADRPFRDRRLLLPLALDPSVPTEFFLRLETSDTAKLQVRAHAPDAVTRLIGHDRLAFGLYLGAVAALTLYNLFIFLWLRERTYLYYVLFQLTTTGFLGAGSQYAYQFLWPGSPRWATCSESLFGGAALAAGVSFVLLFLAGPKGVPLARALRLFRIGAVAMMALSPFTGRDWYSVPAMWFVLSMSTLILVSAVIALVRGSVNARFLLPAWIVMIVSTQLNALNAFGLLPWPDLTDDLMRIGSIMEATMLALGLAYRISLMRSQNERSQADLLRLRMEEAARLEERVAVRTRQLTDALRELASTQARMVRQARLAALGHLVGGVMHEIGNPLNVTCGGIEDVSRRLDSVAAIAMSMAGAVGPAPAAAEHFQKEMVAARTGAGIVRNGSARIKQIVDNLRDYVAQRPGERLPTDIRATIETTLTLVQKRFEDQGIELRIELGALPLVRCRPGEIGQVITNLVVNSCQAMPRGGVLTLRARTSARAVSVVVADSGPGVRPEDRDAIFDPFFTTRDPNEGTGLGLSVSQEIARRHGGDLRLLETATGAAFELTLPADSDSDVRPTSF